MYIGTRKHTSKHVINQTINTRASKSPMDEKRMSLKIPDFRLLCWSAKSPFFSAISFFAIFLFIYSDIISYKISKSPLISLYHESLEEQGTPRPVESTLEGGLRSSLPMQKENIGEAENALDDHDPFILPEGMTRKERMQWFRGQLPKLEILNSTSLSQRFHSRVLEFLNKGCPVQFHTVWLSPARSFGKREFLAMDTFFKVHPQGCLIIVSRTMDTKQGYRILKPLLDRGFKLLAVTPDLPFLVKNTPAEAWLEEMRNGNKDPGSIPLSQNLCNLIRLVMLYKYGGGYMDIDFVLLKDLSALKNVIGAQSMHHETKKWATINGAMMIFDINHPILMDFIHEFASTFDGYKWGFNGPYLVSRVIERVGSTQGYNITILPPKAFYPVDWNKIGKLFSKPRNESETRWVQSMVDELNEGETYAVHLWNRKSREVGMEEGSVMARLVLNHCVICGNVYDL